MRPPAAGAAGAGASGKPWGSAGRGGAGIGGGAWTGAPPPPATDPGIPLRQLRPPLPEPCVPECGGRSPFRGQARLSSREAGAGHRFRRGSETWDHTVWTLRSVEVLYLCLNYLSEQKNRFKVGN